MQTEYILHLDADSFFASCEQAMHPDLEGRAVITGAERGIVSSASYEAKAQGVSRSIPLWEVKRIIPSAVIVASDYESYSIFSERMFSLIRAHIPIIEEYSIDEAFGLISFRAPIAQEHLIALARRIQSSIQAALGISVSIGIAKTKVLAKIGSKYKKPGGITIINDEAIFAILPRIKVNDLWGIGDATTRCLNKHGVSSAWDFYCMDAVAVEKCFTRPILDIWHELHSLSRFAVYPTSAHARQYSIQKVRTFSPPSRDQRYIFSQLVYNLENACIKARRYSLAAKRIGVYLRTKKYHVLKKEMPLQRPSAFPSDCIRLVSSLFDKLYDSQELYRSTGIVLGNLVDSTRVQLSLFEDAKNRDRTRSLFHAIDGLDRKFGKHTVFVGASLPVHRQGIHQGTRNVQSDRLTHRLNGETERQHLHFPFFFINI